MRSIFAFAWLALSVGWCCHAVSDSDVDGQGDAILPEGAPDPAVAPDQVDAPCPADAHDEQPPDEQLNRDEDDDDLEDDDFVVVDARSMWETQKQWDDMIRMKAEQLQLISDIRSLMDRLMKFAGQFDCRLPERPRIMGTGQTMVEHDGVARMVRGSFDHGGAMPPAGAGNPRERITGSARPRSRSATRQRNRKRVRQVG